jgi:hypothetical protein
MVITVSEGVIRRFDGQEGTYSLTQALNYRMKVRPSAVLHIPKVLLLLEVSVCQQKFCT